MRQGLIVLEVRIHAESSSLLFTKDVLIHERVLFVNRFGVLAVRAYTYCRLGAINDTLIKIVKHLTTYRTELHLYLFLFCLYKFVSKTEIGLGIRGDNTVWHS